MKKMLILFLFFIPCSVIAKPEIIVNEDSSVYWNCPNGLLVYTSPLAMIHIDGKLGYSIHPHGSIDYLPNYQLYNKFLYQYDPGLQLYLSKLSYCGYGNHGHNSKEYYMATQEMIWEQFVDVDVTWSPKRADTMTSINIEQYKEDILNCIVEYEDIPHLPTEIGGNLGEIYTFKDEKGLLKYYDITSIHDNNVWIDDDILYVELLSEHEEVLHLNRKIDGQGMQLYIGGAGHQRLATFDANEERDLSITISTPKKLYGNLSLNILNEYDEPYSGDINIYDDNNVSQSFHIDNGLFVTELLYGNYVVEIPILGLTQNEFSFSINSSIHEEKINLEEKKNQLTYKVWNEVLKRGQDGTYYDIILSNTDFMLLANENIIDAYGNIRYHIGDKIDGNANKWNLLSGNYILDGEEIAVKEDMTIERNIEYPKAHISITELPTKVSYQIINHNKIEGIESNSIILQGMTDGDLIVSLPYGEYLLKLENQEFLFQVSEEQNEFLFSHYADYIEDELKDKEKPIIEEVKLPNTHSDFYKYVIFGILLIGCICII